MELKVTDGSKFKICFQSLAKARKKAPLKTCM